MSELEQLRLVYQAAVKEIDELMEERSEDEAEVERLREDAVSQKEVIHGMAVLADIQLSDLKDRDARIAELGAGLLKIKSEAESFMLDGTKAKRKRIPDAKEDL